ncbi:hypothetical protein [Bartonella senegalensis]|nr:hypothetical protein [Bartonella senegalensis]
MIRSSYKAMEDTAIKLLASGHAQAVEDQCVEINRILRAFG